MEIGNKFGSLNDFRSERRTKKEEEEEAKRISEAKEKSAFEKSIDDSIAEFENKRLEKQSFLMGFWDKILENTRPPDALTYVKVIQSDLEFLQNVITDREKAHIFLNATSAQLSALVPKIKLYKIENWGIKGKERLLQFPFENYMNPDDVGSVLKDNSGRGRGVGLENLAWSFEGTHPGDAKNNIIVEASIIFQTVEEIFRERPSGKGFVKFSDLTFYGAVEAKAKNEPMMIRAELGWVVPETNDQTLFSEDFKKSIENTISVLMLYPTEHEIEIRQDGKVSLNLKFAASIEFLLNALGADVISSNTDPKVLEAIRKEEDLFRFIGSRYDVFSSSGAERTEKLDEIEKEEGYEKRKEIEEVYEKNGQQEIDKKVEEIKQGKSIGTNASESAEIILKKNRSSGYQRILKTIIHKYQNPKVYYAEISKRALGIWRKIGSFDLSSERGRQKADEFGVQTGGIDYNRDFRVYRVSNNEDFQGKVEKGIFSQEFVNPVLDSLSKISKGEEETVKQLKTGELDDSYRIYFLFLGDIIDAAINVCLENGADIDKIGFLLGPILMFDPLRGGKPSIASLADIPIALDSFLEWFVTEIIRPGLLTMPLEKFINSLVSSLVESVLNQKEFFDEPSRKQKLGMSIIHVPSEGPAESLFNPSHRTTVSTSFNNDYSSTGENIRNQSSRKILLLDNKIERDIWRNMLAEASKKDSVKQCIFIHMNPSLLSSNLVVDPERDKKSGIHHLFPGSDRGLVKNIKYRRKHIEGFYEARLKKAQERGSSESVLLDVFDADIELIGNTLFSIGSLVYIEPAALLGPSARDKNGRNAGEPLSAARRIGLAGYYRIIKVSSEIGLSGFSTKLECISEVALGAGKDSKVLSTPYIKSDISNVYTGMSNAWSDQFNVVTIGEINKK